MKTPARKPAFPDAMWPFDQDFGAQTEHQPFALTALPGKIWQGRHASPSLP
jgi:hypothetical protein